MYDPFSVLVMLAASISERNVTVWRPSVCLSVPSVYTPWLTRGQHATRPRTFAPITKRIDILITGRVHIV